MYTHIGDGIIIKNRDVIGIFDKKTIDASRENKRIQYEINQANIDCDSILLMEENDRFVELFSQISVATLKKRLEKGLFLNKREVKK